MFLGMEGGPSLAHVRSYFSKWEGSVVAYFPKNKDKEEVYNEGVGMKGRIRGREIRNPIVLLQPPPFSDCLRGRFCTYFTLKVDRCPFSRVLSEYQLSKLQDGAPSSYLMVQKTSFRFNSRSSSRLGNNFRVRNVSIKFFQQNPTTKKTFAPAAHVLWSAWVWKWASRAREKLWAKCIWIQAKLSKCSTY